MRLPNGVFYTPRGRDFSYFGFIPNFGLILGLIVGRFYAMFMACFVASIGRILWLMEKGYFQDGFRSKWRVLELLRSSMARYCIEATLLHGRASKLQPSGMQLRGFWCNCVAPTHLQTSNFKQSYLSRSNSDLHILGLYGKLFESKI